MRNLIFLGKLSVISLSIFVAGSVYAKNPTNTKATPSMAASSPAEAYYSGSGKLPIGIALNHILPNNNSIVLTSNLDMSQVVEWNVSSGTVGQALDQIFHPIQIDWTLTDNSLTLRRGLIFSNTSTLDKKFIASTNSETNKLSDVSQEKTLKTNLTIAVESEPISKTWSLKSGETIRAELTRWAKDANWSLVWQLDKDWVIPANSDFFGEFDVAAPKVIETLAKNGVLIRAEIYEDNHTLVVVGPGVVEK